MSTTRRNFLQGMAGSAAFGLAGLDFVQALPHVSAAEARVDPKLVRLESGIEPLVQLFEQTDRDTLLETVANRVQAGTSYREVLAALLLAAVRNVQPRPSVGFKFHSVLVVNSAHLASLAAGNEDRWLPIFWALDYFKATQLEEERKSGWKLGPVDESALPPASRARDAFTGAMETWDESAADVAVASLARSAAAHSVFDLFAQFGARDYRSIGHKAIYVANSWRAMQTIGWQHAEPVLRSLAYAVLNHTGEPNPAKSDLGPDQAWRDNQERVGQIRETWLDGTPDAAATRELIATLRDGEHAAGAALAVDLLNRGVSPASLWDGIFVASGELLMRQPGIIGLHSLTTANAIHYAWQNVADDRLRKLLLLQACAFVPHFRDSAASRGKLRGREFTDVEPMELEANDKTAALEEIFADVSRDRDAAAAKILQFLAGGGTANDVVGAARQLVFLKGNDAHDYKYSSAVLEDYAHVQPEWRNQFLALSVYNLRGSGERTSRLVDRTRRWLHA